MEDKESMKTSQVLSPEEIKAMAAQKALEEKEKAVRKLEKLKEMKTFFEDFHQADDYFKDVVPQRENEESKFRVISDKSWYIEGDFIFNIELKDWEKENCFDKDKINESLELFFSSDGKDGYGKVSENNLLRTRRIDEKMNSRLPFEKNFCLKIYTLTELKLVLSYDLSISHLYKDFSIQVYDREDFAIICDDFFYYIEYKNLLKFYFDSEKDESVMYRLMKLKDETKKEHGKIYNMVLTNNYKIFFKKGYISEANSDSKIEVYPYSKEKDKMAIGAVFIQAFKTVLLYADSKVYLMDYNEKQAVHKEFLQAKLLTSNFKLKHLLFEDADKYQFLKINGYNSFQEVEFITKSQKNSINQQVDYFDLRNDSDDNTIISFQNHGYYMVFNYKDVENQYFFKYIQMRGNAKLFHSGNLSLTMIDEDDKLSVINQTCTSFKYDLAIKSFSDLKKATEFTDFKQSGYYKLRQIKNSLFVNDQYEFAYKQQWLEGLIHTQLKANNIGRNSGSKSISKINKEFCWKFICDGSDFEIQKCSLKQESQSDPLLYSTVSSVKFNSEILDITPVRVNLSETNQYILATDKELNGVILDIRSQTLIKHDDLKMILQPLTMTEHQIVLLQIGVNQIMINKYEIQNNVLVKKDSFNLTQHVKQFDINNVILPYLLDLNEDRKREISVDQSNRFYYLNEIKNIVIFRLTFQDAGVYDYIVFHLDKFRFIGSFSVNKPLFQMNYDIFCADGNQVYRTSIISQLINNFDLINPQKLHIKIDVVLNKYEFYDLDSQPMHFTQYEFRSLFQIQMNSQNKLKKLSDFKLSRDIMSMSETEIFNYNQGLSSSFLLSCIDRSELVFEECYKRLLQINPPMSPQICAPHLGNGNILDYSVSKHQYRKIGLILNMILKFNNNLLYNHCIDPHICYLLEKKINLKEYFESKLAYPKITSLAYPQYSKDYSVIYQSKIDKKSFTYHSLWNDYDKYLGHSVNEKNDQPLVEVEYNLINIPATMTNKDFIRNLIDSQNLEYYETEFIQTVLNFKWDKYTNKFFIHQFYLYMAFLLSYVLDLYYFTINAEEDKEDSRSIIQQFVLKLTCVGYLLLQEYYELLMMKRIGFVEYIDDLWNVIDQLLALLYFVIVIIDIQDMAYNGIVIMHSFMLILVFVKLCEILRVFQGFSYQVSMLKAVFMDLRYFIMLYGFVLIVYGLIFTLLKIKTSDENVEYDGINYFGYFIMAFRASTGDFQIDNFYELEDTHIIFAWIVWISAVLFLNIILLNFIIAVISESYEKVMQKMVAESFRIKAQLIKERESYFSDVEFKNQKYFPDYIIYRRPVQDEIDDNQEWQGFVKDIKKTIYKTHTKSIHAEEEILHHVQTVELTVKDLQTIIKNQDQIIKNQETSIKTLQTTNNEIKTSVDSILKALESQNVKVEIKPEEKKEGDKKEE
eukprot:403335961